MDKTNNGFKLSPEFILSVLLWVDDVISLAEGEEKQEIVLQKINDFAIRHKLQWGQSKCKVMRVGRHTNAEKEWKLGDLTIQETNSYKYLGDILTNDGKNAMNLESRKNKMQAKSTYANSIAASDVLCLIESTSLIQLHEKENIPGLLTNCESWCLLKGDVEVLERIEIQALKHLFDLPVHTPTPAVIFTFGTIYTNQRVHQRQLIYLHKTLKKYDGFWPKRTIEILEQKNIGWSHKIKETLSEYDLPTDFSVIKTIPRLTWIRNVKAKIEQRNTQRLIDDCHKTVNGVSIPKTKTARILGRITDSKYERGMDKIASQLSRQQCKTLILAKYGMLDCGQNFKGNKNENCSLCGTIENEDHIINHCPKYLSTRESLDQINFDDIYSDQIEVIKTIIPVLEMFWNTSSANGSLKRD